MKQNPEQKSNQQSHIRRTKSNFVRLIRNHQPDPCSKSCFICFDNQLQQLPVEHCRVDKGTKQHYTSINIFLISIAVLNR